MATFISHSPEETAALGEQWGCVAPPGWLIGLTGDLGAGKTQLVKGFARGLGVTARVQSPTFVLVHEYAGGRLPLFHLDLYRLDTPAQIVSAGLEEYFFKRDAVVVVEWMERWLGQFQISNLKSASATSALINSTKPAAASPMKILALEFSSEQRSVAVADGGTQGTCVPLGSAAETATRHTHAFAMIEQALQQARLERAQIECLAVGLGPGSYAGIRTAIAIAQGWQLARGVRLLGISSVEALAAQAHGAKLTGRVDLIIDAQRGEFYLAGYDLDAAGPRCIEPLRLATLEEAQARARDGAMLIGPEAGRWFPSARVVFPDAATIAQLAAGRTDFVTGDKLEPVYLRETSFVKAPPPRIVSDQ